MADEISTKVEINGKETLQNNRETVATKDKKKLMVRH